MQFVHNNSKISENLCNFCRKNYIYKLDIYYYLLYIEQYNKKKQKEIRLC